MTLTQLIIDARDLEIGDWLIFTRNGVEIALEVSAVLGPDTDGFVTVYLEASPALRATLSGDNPVTVQREVK
jgi:hypothetical protein